MYHHVKLYHNNHVYHITKVQNMAKTVSISDTDQCDRRYRSYRNYCFLFKQSGNCCTKEHVFVSYDTAISCLFTLTKLSTLTKLFTFLKLFTLNKLTL